MSKITSLKVNSPLRRLILSVKEKKCFLTVLISVVVLIFINVSLDNNYPSLSEYNPAIEVINEIELPRTYNPIYRGLSPKEFSVGDSIDAMLGDSQKNIKSKLISAINAKCRNKPINKELLENNEAFDFVESVSCSSLQNLSQESQKIAEAKFLEDKEQEDFSDRFLNYSYPLYQDFPSNLIFGSVYVDIADRYSDNVVVYKDFNTRFLDLNYYNYKNYGDWLQKDIVDNRDLGEILTPVVILPEEIIGYELRRLRMDSQNAKKEVLWGLYKILLDGQAVILVIDGEISQNQQAEALINSNNLVYYAEPQAKITTVPKFPKILNNSVNIKGVIAKCENFKSCSVPFEKIVSKYRCSNNKLPPAIQLKITALRNEPNNHEFFGCKFILNKIRRLQR